MDKMKKYAFLLVLFLSLLCNSCLGYGVITPLYDPYAAHIPDDINLGTVEGQMLYWDDANSLWARAEGLAWDDVNGVLSISDVNYLKADGSVDLTSNWTIADRSITLTNGTLTAEHIYSTDDMVVHDLLTTADLTVTSGVVLNFLPKLDNQYYLGAIAADVGTDRRWESIAAATSITVATMTLSSGQIIDSSDAISFGDENLSTTGIGTFDKLDLTSTTTYDGITTHNTEFTIQNLKDAAATGFSFAANTGDIAFFAIYADGNAGSWTPYLYWETDVAGRVSMRSDVAIDFMPSNDNSDYIRFQTVSNVPEITTLGACDLKITASSGVINFDDEDLTTSGRIISTGGNQTGKFLTGSAGNTVFSFSGDNFDIRAGSGSASSQNVMRVDNSGDFDFYDGNLTTSGTLGAGAITGTSLTDGTATLDDGSLTSAVNGTFSGTVQAEQFTSTDDITMAGLFTNTMAAADTQGLVIDGDTNPFTYSSGNFCTNEIKRTYEGSGSSFPAVGIGTQIYDTWDYDYTGTQLNANQLVFSSFGGTISGDININTGTPPLAKTAYLYGSLNSLTMSGTVSTTHANAKQVLEVRGINLLASVSPVYNVTAGTLEMRIYGGYFEGFGNPSGITGMPVLKYYGGYFLGRGNTGGTSTSYGGYFSGTGCDTNYDLYAANTGSLNTIAGKIRIGDTTAPTLTCEIKADSVRVVDTQSPASGGTGTQGEIAWDASYIYVCTATNTWERAALTGGY